ncbi:hypothetical protein HELRODRAFT_190302 [Helobdella robusta]|uniref:C3H1-type domain-containing protein n=1 Tax=Helobdella robusta TaxID=6412 RepID=T1FRV8_HELRO|nr:hypothetical protein HELRODRAFT_190302 [Helobdella robusta]ESO09844.1 hypothetical protein HELRODRAFT_190302 [Helobdella robusta]
MATYILKPGKDARWLTLDVCKEFSKGECPNADTECKFAHPPSHVDVHNGKVVCCFDYIKSKCQRLTPPCKYLHPPTHLKEQLLEMGRQNLIVKNLQLQSALTSGLLQPVIAVSAASNSLPFISSAKPVIPPAYQTMILQNQQYATAGSPYIIPSTTPSLPYHHQQTQYQYISPPAYPSNGVLQLVVRRLNTPPMSFLST